VICCSGFVIGLLALGMMNLYVIAMITAMIALERLSPHHQTIAPRKPSAQRTRACAIGVGLIAIGLIFIARGAIGRWGHPDPAQEVCSRGL
jgi:uncharacterized membrane protein YidH (DUF202 family)